jgi:hypothetical protein
LHCTKSAMEKSFRNSSFISQLSETKKSLTTSGFLLCVNIPGNFLGLKNHPLLLIHFICINSLQN